MWCAIAILFGYIFLINGPISIIGMQIGIYIKNKHSFEFLQNIKKCGR